jgi:hypothetical protein
MVLVETLQISAARSMVIKSGVDNYCSFSRASKPRLEVAFAVVSSSLTFRSQVLGRIVWRTLSLPFFTCFTAASKDTNLALYKQGLYP